ncbi:hypothetical protein [Parafrankia sp. EUN1f]|uniref:hypothetical protein n=1 Tax=Parafrankia sp. EUN1f TaxID=102897 RepID=UPI001E48708E|nr:hypothetical protein [Parafrankia sp. EUN1f]
MEHAEHQCRRTRGDGSVFGLVGDSPRSVRAGCGQHVPYAATSSRPERVTCLPCREHARIEQSAHLGGGDRALAAARTLRDVAHRFT